VRFHIPVCTRFSSCKTRRASRTDRHTCFSSFRFKVPLFSVQRSLLRCLSAMVVGVAGSSISSTSGRRKGVRCWSRLRTSRSFSTLGWPTIPFITTVLCAAMFLKISSGLSERAGDILCEPDTILDLFCDGVSASSALEDLPKPKQRRHDFIHPG
jgi:hypothetical protein